MKRVLLIQPWNYHDEGVVCHDFSQEWRNGPYNLVLLATQLRERNIPVRIADLQPILALEHGSVELCLEHLKLILTDFRPDLVGISFFSCQFMETKVIVSYAQDVCREIGIRPVFIAGGIHATVEPRETVEQIGLDHVFVGEADLGILGLASGEEPEHVPGVVGRETQIPRKGEEVKDLNVLPFPDWGLCHYQFYARPSLGKISGRAARTLDLMMGRGCVHRCAFCAYSTLSKPRFYSPEYLVEQIHVMRDSYSIDSVYFIDSSVGNNSRLVKQFCELSIKKGIPSEIEWYANMRADQVDEDLLRLMWEAGCRSLFYGFESGSQTVLDLMRKGCSVEQNVRAAELHNRLGFPYHASMILGYPGETEEDIDLTFQFLNHTHPPFVGINWYVPLPGSDDYMRLRAQGTIQLHDPHEWRGIGEVLTTGRIFAAVDEERFRHLYSEACLLASRIKAENVESWIYQARHNAEA